MGRRNVQDWRLLLFALHSGQDENLSCVVLLGPGAAVFSCFIEMLGLTTVLSEYARERKEHMKQYPLTSSAPTMAVSFPLQIAILPSLSPHTLTYHTPHTLSHKHTPHALTYTHHRTEPLSHSFMPPFLFCGITSVGFRLGASSLCLVSCLHWIYRFLVGRTDLCVQEPSMSLNLFKFSFKVWSFFSCGSCCNYYWWFSSFCYFVNGIICSCLPKIVSNWSWLFT